MFKYIVKGFEEMMDSIEKGFNETMNVSYPEVERNELELITEYYMKNRPTSGRTTTARYTAVTIRSIVFRPFTWNGTRDYASSNSATTRKPKRPTGGLSTRG